MSDGHDIPVFLKDFGGATHWNIMQSERMPDFEIRPDDVWMCSFPRSGTTVTQQIVYLVMTLDFEAARTVLLDDRFPFADIYRPDYLLLGLDYIEELSREKPRMIKSHLHHCLLPEQLKAGKGKIVYAVRNPKSSLLSQYNQQKYFYKYPTQKTVDEFIEDSLNAKNGSNYSTYLLDGEDFTVADWSTNRHKQKPYATPWGLHVKQYWENSREGGNVHIVQFRDIVNNRKSVIRNIAQFLNKDLTENQVDAIFEDTSIEKMRNNPAVNLDHMKRKCNSEINFINKGLTDGWKDALSHESIRKLDEIIAETVGQTNLKFD